jgi:hypothetical protein
MLVGCKKTELIASKQTQFTPFERNGPEADIRFGSEAGMCGAHTSALGQ